MGVSLTKVHLRKSNSGESSTLEIAQQGAISTQAGKGWGPSPLTGVVAFSRGSQTPMTGQEGIWENKSPESHSPPAHRALTGTSH